MWNQWWKNCLTFFQMVSHGKPRFIGDSHCYVFDIGSLEWPHKVEDPHWRIVSMGWYHHLSMLVVDYVSFIKQIQSFISLLSVSHSCWLPASNRVSLYYAKVYPTLPIPQGSSIECPGASFFVPGNRCQGPVPSSHQIWKTLGTQKIPKFGTWSSPGFSF